MSNPFKPNPLNPKQHIFVPDNSPPPHYHQTMNAGRRPAPAESSSSGNGSIYAGIAVFVLLWLAWIGFIVLKATGTL